MIAEDEHHQCFNRWSVVTVDGRTVFGEDGLAANEAFNECQPPCALVQGNIIIEVKHEQGNR